MDNMSRRWGSSSRSGVFQPAARTQESVAERSGVSQPAVSRRIVTINAASFNVGMMQNALTSKKARQRQKLKNVIAKAVETADLSLRCLCEGGWLASLFENSVLSGRLPPV